MSFLRLLTISLTYLLFACRPDSHESQQGPTEVSQIEKGKLADPTNQVDPTQPDPKLADNPKKPLPLPPEVETEKNSETTDETPPPKLMQAVPKPFEFFGSTWRACQPSKLGSIANAASLSITFVDVSQYRMTYLWHPKEDCTGEFTNDEILKVYDILEGHHSSRTLKSEMVERVTQGQVFFGSFKFDKVPDSASRASGEIILTDGRELSHRSFKIDENQNLHFTDACSRKMFKAGACDEISGESFATTDYTNESLLTKVSETHSFVGSKWSLCKSLNNSFGRSALITFELTDATNYRYTAQEFADSTCSLSFWDRGIELFIQKEKAAGINVAIEEAEARFKSGLVSTGPYFQFSQSNPNGFRAYINFADPLQSMLGIRLASFVINEKGLTMQTALPIETNNTRHIEWQQTNPNFNSDIFQRIPGQP